MRKKRKVCDTIKMSGRSLESSYTKFTLILKLLKIQ